MVLMETNQLHVPRCFFCIMISFFDCSIVLTKEILKKKKIMSIDCDSAKISVTIPISPTLDTNKPSIALHTHKLVTQLSFTDVNIDDMQLYLPTLISNISKCSPTGIIRLNFAILFCCNKRKKLQCEIQVVRLHRRSVLCLLYFE